MGQMDRKIKKPKTIQVMQPSEDKNIVRLNRISEMDNLITYYGSEEIGYDVLEGMYRDPDIERFVWLKASMQASMIHGYRHDNKEIEKFVWDALVNTEGSFHLNLADAIADCTVYGHHFSEVVWALVDGKYIIKRYMYIPPEYRTVLLDKNSDIAGIKFGEAQIEQIKLLYLNFRPNRGIFGKSEIAALYPFYLLNKTAIYNFGKTLERFGFPWAIGKGNNTEELLNMLKNMYNIASAAIGTEESIELIEPKSAGEIFEKALDLSLSAYLRKLGIPELLVNVKNHGTYNLAESQLQWFLDENEELSKNKNNILIEAFVKDLIKINFGVQEDYGNFLIYKTPNAASMKLFSAILQSLSQGNTLNNEIRYFTLEKMGIRKEEAGNSFEKVTGLGSENDNGGVKDDGKEDVAGQ